jgi:hypothetical protein
MVEGYAASCGVRGIAWDADVLIGTNRPEARHAVQPGELVVFGRDLVPDVRTTLLSPRGPADGVLVCPGTFRPISRVLIVNRPYGLGTRFLDRSIELCRALDAPTIVLTVARSESGRRAYEQIARERCQRQNLAATFDSLVSSDPGQAIACAANWRRCSDVFAELHEIPTWRRLLRDDSARKWLELFDRLSFLIFPGDR